MATEVIANPATPGLNDETNEEEDALLLKELNEKTYKEQAIWFLNAFWKTGVAFGENLQEAETVWMVLHEYIKLDPRGAHGNELNEFNAHRLLEKVDKALTVVEMREVLREIDIDFNKSMSLTEFLVYKYRMDWKELVHAPQGGVDEEKLALAQQKVDEANEDIQISETRAQEAKISEKECVHLEMQAKQEEKDALDAENEAIEAEKTAVQSEQEAKAAQESAVATEAEAFREETLAKEAEQKAIKCEEEQQAVEIQVKEALSHLEKEEASFKMTLDKLEKASVDETKGIVSRNKAKAELAQIKSADPMPLQRAKISQEAVVRKQNRATKSAAAAKIASQTARTHSEESRKLAVSSRENADQASCHATSRRRNAEEQSNIAKKAREQASNSREQAEKGRHEAEKFRESAEQALAQSVTSFQEATRFLNKVKKECSTVGKGKIWYMERDLEEAKKYMSKKQLARLKAAPPLAEDQTPVVA